MKKISCFLLALTLIGGVLAGCNGDEADTQSGQESSQAKLSGSISLSGSTSMEKMALTMAEAFMEKHGGVTVDVQLGGSSVGIKNAQDGVSDIGNASRKVKDTETGITATTVAIDGISIIVNKANTVADLSIDQIAKIYKGEIKNWKDVGGADKAIVVVGREAGSGTRDGFEDIAGVKDSAKYAQELNETGAVKTSVQTTEGAIGYVSMSYVDDKIIAVKVDGVIGSESTVKDGSYKMARPFVMVTKQGTVRAEVKAFLDFVLSDDAKPLLDKLGLFSAQ